MTLTPEQMKKAVRALGERAARAEQDPAEFLSFVFRSEDTGARITTPPHMRVMLHFAAAHQRYVIRGFPGCGKTTGLAALFTQKIGQNVRDRFAIVSGSLGQAEKPLGLVARAIENEGGQFPELKVVFPHLQKSRRRGDKWTQSAITVQRPANIRDPSLVAFGFGGKKLGARLQGVAIDDILSPENTATPESRAKVNHWVLSTIATRQGTSSIWIGVWNVPWDDGSGNETPDLTYALEKAGWPTLEMAIDGTIKISNTTWESDDLRPSVRTPGTWRLTAHDTERYGAPMCVQLPDGTIERVKGPVPTGLRMGRFDLDDEIFLWPEVFGPKRDEEIRELLKAYPDVYWSSYRMKPRRKAGRDEKLKWIERAKAFGRALGIHTMTSRRRGNGNPTFTGYDLAFGMGDEHDLSALFTFEVIPSIVVPDDTSPSGMREIRNARLILDIAYGHWTSKDKAVRAVGKARDFGSILRVESNGAQVALKDWIADLAETQGESISVHAHNTDANNKVSRLSGIASVFFELENGSWIIPCRPDGSVEEPIQRWIDEMLAYDPEKHVGDLAIAGWLARSQARETLGSAFAPDIRELLNAIRHRAA